MQIESLWVSIWSSFQNPKGKFMDNTRVSHFGEIMNFVCLVQKCFPEVWKRFLKVGRACICLIPTEIAHPSTIFWPSEVFNISWCLTSKPNSGTTHSLNCSKDAKHGFFGEFYIDIVSRKFSQLFFFDRKKCFLENEKYFSEDEKIYFWNVKIPLRILIFHQ